MAYKARKDVLYEKIDPADFKIMKAESEKGNPGE
jgi:hypothetical protein